MSESEMRVVSVPSLLRIPRNVRTAYAADRVWLALHVAPEVLAALDAAERAGAEAFVSGSPLSGALPMDERSLL